MPNVLVLGASGYLGLAVGQALLRTGNYIVWGLARSQEKTKFLASNEITPIIGDATDEALLSSTISENKIDIVIDTTSEYRNATAILKAVTEASKDRIRALGKEKSLSPKLGFVYTSGSWVHGSPQSRISDLSPVGNRLAQDKPATAVAWRPAHEQCILAARDVLDVAILRPSAIYGRGSWVWGTWWSCLLEAKKSGANDSVKVPADDASMTGTIHVDDLAAAYVAAVDQIDRIGNWPVFDVLNETIHVTEIMEAAKKFFGINAPLEYLGTMGNPFLEALSLQSKGNSSRARSVLGWQPSHGEFLLNLATYLKAWEASQEAK